MRFVVRSILFVWLAGAAAFAQTQLPNPAFRWGAGSAPNVNVGNTCGYPVANQLCVGGVSTYGLKSFGPTARGNNGGSSLDAFVWDYIDHTYVNPNQEMRGHVTTLRTGRQVGFPDEPTLGWDVIPMIAATVVDESNRQNIIGNLKGFVSETHFPAPTIGSYTARNAYNFQAILAVLGAGVTLQNWQGFVVSDTPTSGGTLQKGSGIEIGNITATDAAALRLNGVGAKGRIKWPNWSARQETDNTLRFGYDATDYMTATAGSLTVQGYQPFISVKDTNASGASLRIQHANASTAFNLDTTGGGSFGTKFTIDAGGVVVGGRAKLTALTVATLPACSAGEAGSLYYVTDANAPTWNATLAGGGAVKTLALCNGTNWTAH